LGVELLTQQRSGHVPERFVMFETVGVGNAFALSFHPSVIYFRFLTFAVV
jgi:hypothetical protein